MATRHDAVPDVNDAEVLVDVDLLILGTPSERFDEYEQQVRDEYFWVPESVFRKREEANFTASSGAFLHLQHTTV